MGGKAFEDVAPITLEQYRDLLPDIESRLRVVGATKVKPIGSSGKCMVMGDIDLAVEHPSGRDALAGALAERFSVRKFGARQLAVRWPVNNGFVQVDVMVGDSNWLSWSRFGPCRSEVKGAVRNLLINAVLRERADGDSMDRKRLTMDWDQGLCEVVQTKRGKNCTLAQWKTTDSRLVTTDPDACVNMIFGKGYSAQDILRFEDAVRVVKEVLPNAAQVLRAFVTEAEDLAQRAPHTLGAEPQQALAAIKRIALG
jgi:hypothetical protein